MVQLSHLYMTTRKTISSIQFSLVAQSCLTLCNSMDSSMPGSSVHGNSLGKNNGVGCHVLLQGGDPPNPGIKSGSPTLQMDFLPTEPPGKPNTGVGSITLLQGIFLTKESNQGFLHCRWILYQLSYQGNLAGNAQNSPSQASAICKP